MWRRAHWSRTVWKRCLVTDVEGFGGLGEGCQSGAQARGIRQGVGHPGPTGSTHAPGFQPAQQREEGAGSSERGGREEGREEGREDGREEGRDRGWGRGVTGAGRRGVTGARGRGLLTGWRAVKRKSKAPKVAVNRGIAGSSSLCTLLTDAYKQQCTCECHCAGTNAAPEVL